jgi:hypothetical protein
LATTTAATGTAFKATATGKSYIASFIFVLTRVVRIVVRIAAISSTPTLTTLGAALTTLSRAALAALSRAVAVVVGIALWM